MTSSNKSLIVTRTFKFDAAHQLPTYKGKCKNLHGHTWSLVVGVEGLVDTETGFVLDFSVLKKIVNEKVIDILDHTYLNALMVNPTCENLIVWIGELLYQPLRSSTTRLCYLKLYESADSFATLDCSNWEN